MVSLSTVRGPAERERWARSPTRSLRELYEEEKEGKEEVDLSSLRGQLSFRRN
jgi:hypothetical protein